MPLTPDDFIPPSVMAKDLQTLMEQKRLVKGREYANIREKNAVREYLRDIQKPIINALVGVFESQGSYRINRNASGEITEMYATRPVINSLLRTVASMTQSEAVETASETFKNINNPTDKGIDLRDSIVKLIQDKGASALADEAELIRYGILMPRGPLEDETFVREINAPRQAAAGQQNYLPSQPPATSADPIAPPLVQWSRYDDMPEQGLQMAEESRALDERMRELDELARQHPDYDPGAGAAAPPPSTGYEDWARYIRYQAEEMFPDDEQQQLEHIKLLSEQQGDRMGRDAMSESYRQYEDLHRTQLAQDQSSTQQSDYSTGSRWTHTGSTELPRSIIPADDTLPVATSEKDKAWEELLVAENELNQLHQRGVPYNASEYQQLKAVTDELYSRWVGASEQVESLEQDADFGQRSDTTYASQLTREGKIGERPIDLLIQSRNLEDENLALLQEAVEAEQSAIRHPLAASSLKTTSRPDIPIGPGTATGPGSLRQPNPSSFATTSTSALIPNVNPIVAQPADLPVDITYSQGQAASYAIPRLASTPMGERLKRRLRNEPEPELSRRSGAAEAAPAPTQAAAEAEWLRARLEELPEAPVGARRGKQQPGNPYGEDEEVLGIPIQTTVDLPPTMDNPEFGISQIEDGALNVLGRKIPKENFGQHRDGVYFEFDTRRGTRTAVLKNNLWEALSNVSEDVVQHLVITPQDYESLSSFVQKFRRGVMNAAFWNSERGEAIQRAVTGEIRPIRGSKFRGSVLDAIPGSHGHGVKSKPKKSGILKPSKEGVLGDMVIDMAALQNRLELIVKSKNGKVMMRRKNVPLGFIELLTKRYNTKSTYDEESKNLYRRLLQKANVALGAGADSLKRDVLIVKDEEEMIERLELLVGEIEAGNNNKKLKNEAVNIIDYLMKKKTINKADHRELHKTIMGK